MKRPNVSRFLSTDEWRSVAQRGGATGLRKEAEILSFEAMPASADDPGSTDWWRLLFRRDALPDRFGDRFGTFRVASGVTLGFGFDQEITAIQTHGVESTAVGVAVVFRLVEPNEFWRSVLGLLSLGALDRLGLGLLPGGWVPKDQGYWFDAPDVLRIDILPPLGAGLMLPGMEPVRDWAMRIAAGQPEKTERYELVGECLRDLPAPPAPTEDPDQVLLDAMRELTAALKENTHEMRCLQGKGGEQAH